MEDPPSLLVDYHSPWQIPDSPLISEEPTYQGTNDRRDLGNGIETREWLSLSYGNGVHI